MEHTRWGLLIVLYLFLGGLSAGLFFFSSLATYLRSGDQPAYPGSLGSVPCWRRGRWQSGRRC